MKKRLITAYAVFSFLMLLFLIVWIVFRTSNTRSENLLSSRKELERISRTATSSYLTTRSFSSQYFSKSVLNLIGESERLRALVVSTDPGRLEFAYAATIEYLPSDIGFEDDLSIPVSFSFNPFTEQTISTSSVVPSARDFRIDAVYSIIGRSEIFPIVRELMIGLLSFLLVTAIVIIVHPYLSAKSAKQAVPVKAGIPDGYAVDEERTSLATTLQFAEQKRKDAAAKPGETAPPVDPRPLADAAGSGTTGAAASEQHDGGGLYSPSTQLVREQYLEERLSAELKRAASFDQDLVLLLGYINGLKRLDPFYAHLSQIAREFFNFQDLCFEYGDGGIAIIIPNVDIDQGIERVEGFSDRVNSNRHIRDKGGTGGLFLGLSARNGRLISGKRIIREAESALRRAKVESVRIMAFRVDPEKYRDYLASRKTPLQR